MNRFKYLVSIVAALVIYGAVEAQEVVSDALIYNRVTEHIATHGNDYDCVNTRPRNSQKIAYEHDLRITYGAPGLISYTLLDARFIYYSTVSNFPNRVDEYRTKSTPRHTLATLGIGYSKQYNPWFAFGCKSTFAASWQKTFDTITSEYLYNTNAYNVSLMLDSRFSWLRRETITMYSSFALGILAHIERANGGYTPFFDATLVGISVGRSLYGFAEVGVGIGGSVRVGIGYRFNGKK